ncbi:hypothetical protein PSTG_08044 [Puccinia striiformis f. sp. tritici PST-78]|uniref:Uncharacterized protein n=4 Tax=Puccinia striiformis TaxID=27350 RepID=A0A0L0VI53_9BASI|nr:hypothetical protein PSTG_08044 [Puccinia striiformis f. sp. tritici PST-78]
MAAPELISGVATCSLIYLESTSLAQICSTTGVDTSTAQLEDFVKLGPPDLNSGAVPPSVSQTLMPFNPDPAIQASFVAVVPLEYYVQLVQHQLPSEFRLSEGGSLQDAPPLRTKRECSMRRSCPKPGSRARGVAKRNEQLLWPMYELAADTEDLWASGNLGVGGLGLVVVSNLVTKFQNYSTICIVASKEINIQCLFVHIKALCDGWMALISKSDATACTTVIGSRLNRSSDLYEVSRTSWNIFCGAMSANGCVGCQSSQVSAFGGAGPGEDMHWFVCTLKGGHIRLRPSNPIHRTYISHPHQYTVIAKPASGSLIRFPSVVRSISANSFCFAIHVFRVRLKNEGKISSPETRKKRTRTKMVQQTILATLMLLSMVILCCTGAPLTSAAMLTKRDESSTLNHLSKRRVKNGQHSTENGRPATMAEMASGRPF